ncbi:DUF3048 domain-containing protein [Jeotgalibacillus sp. S-D1]|uniref:DUF3048 domain-containing protein n=1 Tax=Jeotgalibacillus sp. S-D1 TaxID=2552189 RepID=UPI00105A87FE|nr:DUF3048 domain-containing protein [Jeotgalibacillus sp. S-D1]TDL30615.1 DUF3048 domain-containing protein [Jeotgalibacillus sp. S-D1]
MKRFLLVFFACLTAGCSQVQKAEEQNSVNQSSESPIGEENKEAVTVDAPSINPIFPLTGKPSNAEYDQRAVSVILNNHKQARPQSGLAEADLVYELLAEGGITRLLAIYQSQLPDRVGPIRSARDYHIQLAKGFDSFFVAHGYSPDALEMLEAGVIEHMNGIKYDGELFIRSSDREAPHNSYSSYELIQEGAERQGDSLEGAPEAIIFQEDPIGSEAADAVSFSVSVNENADYNSKYQYDPTSHTYTRMINGETTIDQETQEAVSISNVIVLEADHQIVDDEGRLMIDLVSGGDAYVFQRGELSQMTWKDVNGRMIPFIDDKPAPMAPGLSWIHIIPKTTGFEQSVTIHE